MKTVQNNTDFFPGVDTKLDIIGKATDFSVIVQLADDGTVTTNNGSGLFDEVVTTHSGNSSTLSKPAGIGTNRVKLADMDIFTIGDTVKLGTTEFNFVTNVVDHYVVLKNKLLTDLAVDTPIIAVGNTGVYTAECNIEVSGEYNVIIKHLDSKSYVMKYQVGGLAIDAVSTSAITAELLSTDASLFTTADSVGAAIFRSRFLASSVYVDTDAVINGDGSQGFPFNNVNNARDFAETAGITNIILAGDVVVPSNLKNMNVYGIGMPRIDFNGMDLKNTKFVNCAISGAFTANIIAEYCTLEDGVLLRGYYLGCALMGRAIAAAGSDIIMTECLSGIPGTDRPSLELTPGEACAVSVRSQRGGLTVRYADQVDDVITVEIVGGALKFDNTCTAGTMVARGGCIFVDETNGATVIDETYHKDVNVVSFETPDVVATPVWNKIIP